MANAAKITERGIDGVVVEATIPASQPGDTFPAGAILAYAGSAAPTGWIVCDGSAVSRAGFPTLFTNIGTAFGAGDGSTTFNIPDLRGKVPIGVSVSHLLATSGGAETHAITVNEMPSHNHGGATGVEAQTHNHGGVLVDSGLKMSTTTTGSGWIIPAIGSTGNESAQHQHVVNSQGGGTAMSLMQPYLTLNYIIRAY